MKHDLVRPCAECPFRRDIRPFLTQARAKEIVDSLRRDQSFQCHQTLSFDDDEDGRSPEQRKVEQQCAGVMIIRERHNRPDQMMRVAERLGFYDRLKLDMAAPVYGSFREFIAAQPERRGGVPPVTAIVETLEKKSCG